MNFRTLAALICLLLALPVAAEEAETEEQAPETTTYQLVFIRANPEFEREGSGRLADHREDRYKNANARYLQSLVTAKWAIVAGPIEGHEDIRYAVIMQVEDMAQAEFAFQENPSVQSGRVLIDVYEIEAPAGILRVPEQPETRRNAHIGLLVRAKDRPQLSDDELEAIREARVEHNEEKIATGMFVMEAEVKGGGSLRSILIFRQRTPEPIRKLMTEDPGVVAGLYDLQLHRWRVSKRNWARRSYQLGHERYP